MTLIKTVLPLALAAAALTGCATVQRVDAAADAHAFLIAIRDNDKPAFNKYVDKPALSREMEAGLDRLAASQTNDQAGRAIAAVLAGPVARAAANAAIRPDVFRALAVSWGYAPDKPIPGQFVIARALRPIGAGQVCAAKGPNKPCLLTFSHEGDVWRLTSVDIGSLEI
jgi:hypothetical protein